MDDALSLGEFAFDRQGEVEEIAELKPHDLRHAVAMEGLEQHHDLVDLHPHSTAQLKRVVSFYEERAAEMLGELDGSRTTTRSRI